MPRLTHTGTLLARSRHVRCEGGAADRVFVRLLWLVLARAGGQKLARGLRPPAEELGPLANNRCHAAAAAIGHRVQELLGGLQCEVHRLAGDVCEGQHAHRLGPAAPEDGPAADAGRAIGELTAKGRDAVVVRRGLLVHLCPRRLLLHLRLGGPLRDRCALRICGVPARRRAFAAPERGRCRAVVLLIPIKVAIVVVVVVVDRSLEVLRHSRGSITQSMPRHSRLPLGEW
mmetsp:Transcript_54229/g.156711  ORF Transcript_54229/g.156711 Transcript_54229/m.156711 type:complete len:230 (-) Transcript_54229:1562-2251(-)